MKEIRVRLPTYGEAMEFDELLNLVRTLRDNLAGHTYKTPWHKATREDDGVISMGFPEYEP